jgi:hypothetical protein
MKHKEVYAFVLCMIQERIFFFFLVHMKRYNHDGMIDYENSDGVMDDEELEGDHRRFFFPTFLLLFSH